MITGDYHTHTTYSHGLGSILDNANEAKNKGLKELAITDHGSGHIFFGIDRNSLPKMREEVDEAQKITGVKVLLGVEANFTSTHGDVDVTEEDLKILDILCVGHHRFVKSSFKDKLIYFFPNMILGNCVTKKIKKRNTDLVIKAMDKYPIDILTHLNYQMPLDIKRIAKKAKETKTYIELNAKKMCFSPEELKILIHEKVEFIINSDAHKPENVGKVQKALEFIEKYQIPTKLIANYDKTPVFKKFRKQK